MIKKTIQSHRKSLVCSARRVASTNAADASKRHRAVALLQRLLKGGASKGFESTAVRKFCTVTDPRDPNGCQKRNGKWGKWTQHEVGRLTLQVTRLTSSTSKLEITCKRPRYRWIQWSGWCNVNGTFFSLVQNAALDQSYGFREVQWRLLRCREGSHWKQLDLPLAPWLHGIESMQERHRGGLMNILNKNN